jgi:hypothetical protein
VKKSNLAIARVSLAKNATKSTENKKGSGSGAF